MRRTDSKRSLARVAHIVTEKVAVPSDRTWPFAVFALAAVAGLAWRFRYFIHDDAFISLRYVRNLLDHGELVWNLGERVEGYTNFLHLLFVALLGWLGVPLIAAAQTINLLALIGLLFGFHRAVRVVAPTDPVARGLGWVCLCTTGPILLWVFGGLEPVMVAALALGATVPLLASTAPGRNGSVVSGVLFGLAALTRPDAALLAILVAAAVLNAAPWPWPDRVRTVAVIVTFLVSMLAVHVLWRYRYYGAFLPNTVAAKLGFDITSRLAEGMSYLIRSIDEAPQFVAAAAVIVACGVLRRSIGWPMMPSAILLVGQTAYVVWAGGDHMVGARFLVPVLPFAALALAEGVAAIPARRAIRCAAVPTAAIAAMLSLVLTPTQPMDGAAFVGRLVGEYMARAWPKDSLVALNSAGSAPYTASNLVFVDMLGLNDPMIARRDVESPRLPLQQIPGHLKGDGAYVVSREPDFIVAGPTEGARVEASWFLSDLELAELPEFRRCYRLERESIHYDAETARRGPSRPRPLIFTYYRRTCAKTNLRR